MIIRVTLLCICRVTSPTFPESVDLLLFFNETMQLPLLLVSLVKYQTFVRSREKLFGKLDCCVVGRLTNLFIFFFLRKDNLGKHSSKELWH